MKRGKLFKSTVAMVALTAMLMENTYSVMASAGTDIISDPSEAVILEEKHDGDSSAAGQDTIVTEDTEGTGEVLVDNSDKEIEIKIGDDSSNLLSEPVSELSDTVNAYEDRIEVTGSDDVTLYINTDRMNGNDTFGLAVSGGAGIDYDRVLDGELIKGNGGVYHISGLEKEKTVINIRSLSEGMSVEYTIRRDGNPQITLISKDAPEVAKSLRVASGGYEVKGSGYDDLTLTFDSSSLQKNAYFSLYIKTAADITCNGKQVSNGVVSSLSTATSSLRLSGLNNEAFTIYIEGENVSNIKAGYSIASVDNGAVSVTLKQADGDVFVEHERLHAL